MQGGLKKYTVIK